MDSQRLKKLFSQARASAAAPPEPSADFAERVVARLPRSAARSLHEATLSDTLRNWFPRVAVASLLFIAVCLFADAYSEHQVAANPSLQLTQASEQWLFGTLEN